ncbi:MAG: hypothetical protein VX899_03040 [Myxococcota bacterium]|nr:hypothetical protein [Myxococcota bacterium]
MLWLVALVACASECDDMSRVNGTYEVLSTVNTFEPEDAAEDMPTYSVFFNGLWDWDLQYQRDSGNLRLKIDGQETTARLTEGAGSCNRFGLRIPAWTFVGDATELGDAEPVDANHALEWEAELVWQGEELSGTYTVIDEWSTTDGLSGSMSATGTVAGTLVEDTEGAEE